MAAQSNVGNICSVVHGQQNRSGSQALDDAERLHRAEKEIR